MSPEMVLVIASVVLIVPLGIVYRVMLWHDPEMPLKRRRMFALLAVGCFVIVAAAGIIYGIVQ